MIGNVDRIARLHELEAPKELLEGEVNVLRERLDKLFFAPTVITIPARVAIELIKSIIIRLDDEDFAFIEDGELQAWAEIYRKLSVEQRAEVEAGLPECYRILYVDDDGTIEENRDNALHQLAHYVNTGVNCRKRD
jgi:hypothetical protein